MKRILKWAGFAILAILILVGGFLAYVALSPIPSYENQAPDLKIEVTEARVAEGARIASMMCANCHRSEDRRLGGNLMADAADFGDIYAANITQHPEYGITDYTDGELVYLLRTGIRKNGKFAPPYMPKWPNMSDEDIASIVAFLRSDHPMVQPSNKPTVECQPNLLAKALCRTVIKPLPYPKAPIVEPSSANEVQYGKYLATGKFDCYPCHSADFKTINFMEPSETAGFMGGGNPIPDLEGNIVLSSNLTMCKESGLGNWTKDEFVKAVKHGVKNDGSAVVYPMLPFSQMTDQEAEAIWAYLETVPVIRNEALIQ